MEQQKLAQQLLAYLKRHRHELLELLRGLVSTETPTAAPASHQPILPLLSAALVPLNYKVEHLPGPGMGEHFYAYPSTYQKGDPAQLILGHYDTVWPLGTLATMPIVEKDGKLTGPGVYDMKAGLVQGIYALHALHSQGIKPELAPLLFICSDEESGSLTSTPFIRELSQRVERAFVLEPGFTPEGYIKTARKGVGRFTIAIHGVAAHAGLEPEKGQSAILELAHIIQAVHTLNDEKQGISVNVGIVEGGISPNVIAPESVAVVDVRVSTLAQGKQIEEQIYAIKPQNPAVHLEISGNIRRPPMEPTERNRALWQQAYERGKWLGLELQEATVGGGSDGNTTSQYTATLDGLGAVGDHAHNPEEYIYIEHTFERCALLALLLCAPPASPPSPQ